MPRTSSPKKARAGAGRTLRFVQAESLRRWIVRARQRGLTGPELVFRLHVRRGMPLPEVALVLGLRLWEVRDHWRQHCIARAALAPKPDRVSPPLAPKSAADVSALRAHLSVALWETLVSTFPDVTPDAENGNATRPAPAPPPMLSIRIKALNQIAKLYELDLKSRETAIIHSYATPEEIAESVREWMRRKDEG